MEQETIESGIYGNEEGSAFVVFGGKINVGCVLHRQTKKHAAVFQELDKKVDVGTENPEDYDIEKPSIFLLFDSKEEVDVVIDVLNEIKKNIK